MQGQKSNVSILSPQSNLSSLRNVCLPLRLFPLARLQAHGASVTQISGQAGQGLHAQSLQGLGFPTLQVFME